VVSQDGSSQLLPFDFLARIGSAKARRRFGVFSVPAIGDSRTLEAGMSTTSLKKLEKNFVGAAVVRHAAPAG
jgi:hypothetical protein